MPKKNDENSAARIGGLALLDWLRPPAGFVTEWALGTTYSLDLVACAAALVALDGGANDTAKVGLTSALRAMHNLKDKVVVVSQEGCIHVPKKTRADILPLLDKFVKTVRLDLKQKAFHPKVWLVCQKSLEADEGGWHPIRYVLTVGSRNLTVDTSWDFGVGLVGTVVAEPSSTLPRVSDFVQFIGALAGIEEFTNGAQYLEYVDWQRPKDVDEFRFDFHGDVERKFDDTVLGELAATDPTKKVLWISPFLDARAVDATARLWANTREKRLVAGKTDLDKVSHKATLQELNPHWMISASQEPAERPILADESSDDKEEHDDETGENAEMEEISRGLHAKIVAVWHGKTASMLVGSPNLTSRGYLGKNVEAWVVVTGQPWLANALWNWAEKVAAEYEAPPEPEPGKTDEEARLERLHHEIACREFTLYEYGPAKQSKLSAAGPPLTALNSDVLLYFERLSQLGHKYLFPAGKTSALLPGCDASHRSELLVFSLETQSLQKRWIQRVQVEPEIDTGRDAALLHRVLPPPKFLEYIRCLLDPDVIPNDADIPEVEGDERKTKNGTSRKSGDAIGLEPLLRAIAKAKDIDTRFGEVDLIFRAYLERTPNMTDELSAMHSLWENLRLVYGT